MGGQTAKRDRGWKGESVAGRGKGRERGNASSILSVGDKDNCETFDITTTTKTVGGSLEKSEYFIHR